MRDIFLYSPAVFFDQDGTLNKWRWIDINLVKQEGYFKTVKPHTNVITASDILSFMGRPVGTYGAAWLEDGHSVADKDWWMDKYVSHIPKEDRVYVPCGSEKASYFAEKVGRKITKADILIDDCSEVLRSWESYGGTGIKVRTEENGHNGTWRGYSFNADASARAISEYILFVQRLALSGNQSLCYVNHSCEYA